MNKHALISHNTSPKLIIIKGKETTTSIGLINMFIKRIGVFFGQCSEICGVNQPSEYSDRNE